MPRRIAWALACVTLCSAAGVARATGVCDSNPPASTDACTSAVQSGGTVVNDIFRDVNGLTGTQLPALGSLYNAWPGCDLTSFAGCAGRDTPPFDCPGLYTCDAGVGNTFANAAAYLDGLDHLWWHPCRTSNHTMTGACPGFGSCIGDGVPGEYFPWEGLVFDLHGPSNKVVVFATNDHGPQPCESLEYTIYLTDHPESREVVTMPLVTGVDPTKWNRAVLTTVFTQGWIAYRAPDPVAHAACGDTALYSVEQDSFVQVFALPCGITFRYAAVIAGNDGLDFPACAFDSSEAELDAVAGLSENGAGVCPDADGDHFVDCACPGAPPLCDCNDIDPMIHPGAPEACDDPDLDCDGMPGACAAGLTCYQSLCLPTCHGEFGCPAGSECTATPTGTLCVPVTCTIGGCPPGAACVNGQCVPDCLDVVCPADQECRDGNCVDRCAGVVCPNGQVCDGGACVPPCTCLAATQQCTAQPGTACDPDGTCVPAACVGVDCPATQHCDATGTCVGLCTPDVVCPVGQRCDDDRGCVPRCDGVVCPGGLVCDPSSGDCVDPLCLGVTCTPPDKCIGGICVSPIDAGTDGGNGAEGGQHGGCCDSGGSPRGAIAPLVLVLAGLLRRRRRIA